ncbi:MAG TPA: glucodextranase DOMON-like domain-containing protein [Trueperaceae bacterium]
MFEAFVMAALITLSDPAGDAVGNGSLTPPSAEVYRNLAPFDLRQVTVTDDPQLTLRIEMGSLSDPFELPMGFSLPVIEVYVSGEEGGRNELLSGSGMRLPQGQGWEVAVRLTGAQATAYRTSSAPGGVESAPATVTTVGNELLVTTPYPRPDRPRVYAITGLYDLFGASPWRPLERQESPWAFSSETQRLPVVDVLARGETRQSQAIDAGILPPARNSSPIPGAFWLVLMAVGLLVSLAGVAMRVLSRPVAADPGGDDGPHPRDPTSPDPVSWEAVPKPEAASGSEPERRPFTWDSSALLTEPSDEELDAELENEFGHPQAQKVGSGGKETGTWQRPVPLPFRRTGPGEPRRPDGEADPEVVRDEAGSDAGESETAPPFPGAERLPPDAEGTSKVDPLDSGQVDDPGRTEEKKRP